jgi:hypothetical protein
MYWLIAKIAEVQRDRTQVKKDEILKSVQFKIKFINKDKIIYVNIINLSKPVNWITYHRPV